ncbi:MAG: CBS domain-containing protein [Proteobacteria bacterium]|nr:CBS domain-containing protein [Pseudomonadota bacterium]
MTGNGYTRVRTMMRPSPGIIDGLASVQEALEIMRRDNVGALIIDRRDEGDEYGIIVLSDIAAKVIAENRAPERTSVYEVMSKPVLAVNADMDIKYAIRLLSRFDLSRALVTDDGLLVGLVSLREMVFRYVHRSDDEENSGE